MCGIVGVVDPKPGAVNRAALQKMARTLFHRGPDDEGFYIDGHVGLGHRRLSIIDLVSGKQPMSNEDGSIWITYNGEIYNFQGIQSELERKGHRFRTRSDTEGIIHAYEEYGEDCLTKFRGMFAFCIWNARKQELFLARDRIGKKPLYYYFDGERFIFASEIKGILAYRDVERKLDPSGLVDYFVYHYVPFPKSIFKNVFKLPPGHCMTVRVVRKEQRRGPRGLHREEVNRDYVHASAISYTSQKIEIATRRYWDIDFTPDFSKPESYWIEGVREKLKEAVKLRLISDVPLGAFLSGGVDSSAVVAMMALSGNATPKTFSIAFEEEDFNEIEYARAVARKFATDHHEFVVRPDAIEALEKLSWVFDEPFADSSAAPTYYVSKMARSEVTVILSGDGGDEAFAGYDRYLVADRWEKYNRVPLTVRQLVFGGLSGLLPFGMKGKGRLGNLSQAPFERTAGTRTFDQFGYLEKLLRKDILDQVFHHKVDWKKKLSFLRQFYDRYPNLPCVSKLQYEDMKTYLAEDIMAKVDRASMLCSLETRAPLLDHELLEFAAHIPAGLQIKNGEKKYVLKTALEGLVPEGNLIRKKKGFEIPIRKWFKKDLVDYSKSVLLSQQCKNRGLLNPVFVERVIETHKKKMRDVSHHIWALLFFEHWCRNWLD